MNNKPASSPTGGSATRLRRSAVLALCASLLTVTFISSSAQRRTTVRVPRGESAAPVEPRREGRVETEAERRREGAALRARLRAQARGGGNITSGDQRPDGSTVGRPTEGRPGVARTTADLMLAQSFEPEVQRTPRVSVEREIPGREFREQDTKAKAGANWASGAAGSRRAILDETPKGGEGPTPRAPQTLGLNFDTVTGPNETGAFPPDTMGAVGPSQFFVFLNGRMRTFNKTTGAADGVLNVDSDVFFAPVMTTPLAGEVVFTSDPQVRYDRLSGRWILIILDVILNSATGATTRSNRVLVAVSDAASSNAITASTVWTFYFIQQDTVGGIASTNQFLDYPSLGVDANALYIGGDMFSLAGSFVNTAGLVVRKSSILSGGPVVVTAFRNLIGTDGPLEPRGVDNYDPAATEGYFIGVSFAAFGRLNMRRVSDPGGTPTISADIPLSTPLTTTSAISVNHLGNTGGTNGRVDGLDDRLYAAHIRNGRLWTAHSFTTLNTGVASTNTTNRRNSVRWYEINVPAGAGTPTFVQSGTVFDSVNVTQATARQYWLPSIMVSGQGHAALGYSTGGTPFRLDAATNGRLSGDTLGTTGAVNIYTTSSTAYNPPGDPGPPRRWGDYSFTTLDPLDDMTMWTIQEYCNGTNTYGARVVKLGAPPPAAPNTASPASVPAGQSSVSVVITGTSVSGSGFYDPGTNLAAPALPFNHISATVSGGVTVNSITYNSPTQVTLDLNTTAAAPGAKNVTINNPDGQSATSNNVLYVGTPPPSPILVTEFRFHGAAGAADEFVELYNNSNSTHTVTDTAGGTGYAVVATTAAGAFSLRCTVPNGTVIPARGHYLCTNSTAVTGYSLGGSATGDATYTTDIADGGGVAVFSTTTSANWGTGTRYDAVGFAGITGTTLFAEGIALAPAGGVTTNGEYSFVRRAPTSTGGLPVDTDSNQADFDFVSTTAGTFNTRVSVLGAPGPENFGSPTLRNSLQSGLLNPSVSASSSPNRDRDTSAGAVGPNAAFGTLTVRRSITNNTATPITRLRFRVIQITTLNSPTVLSGQAEVRVLNSGSSVITVNGVPTTVEGTTVETPPTQSLGGGLNSTLGRSPTAGTVINTSIAPGQTVNVQWVLGVQVTGNYQYFVNIEALP